MYFRECPHCGCHLDPGEQCDCQDEKQKTEQAILSQIILADNQQYSFDFERIA